MRGERHQEHPPDGRATHSPQGQPIVCLWEACAGAATAPDVAVPTLAKALGDTNADVRKAAVPTLLRHEHEDARAVLPKAMSDADAGVRACTAWSVTSARPA